MTRWGEGEVSAESIGQTAFLVVAWPRDAKPTHPGAGWRHRGPNWAKTLPREAGWPICGVEMGEAKRKFRLEGEALRHRITLAGEFSETRSHKSFASKGIKLGMDRSENNHLAMSRRGAESSGFLEGKIQRRPAS